MIGLVRTDKSESACDVRPDEHDPQFVSRSRSCRNRWEMHKSGPWGPLVASAPGAHAFRPQKPWRLP